MATIDYGGRASIGYRTGDLDSAIIKYEFDENGNITSERDYDSKEDFILGYSFIYDYNKDRTINKKTVTMYFGSSDYQSTWYVDYEYSNKKPTKITVSMPPSSNSSVLPNGLENTAILEYKKGQVSKIETRFLNNERMNAEYNLTYKKNYFILNGDESVKYDRKTGNVIDFNGQLQLDESGRVVSCQNLQISPFDNPMMAAGDVDCSKVYYKYDEFDEYGNWTVRIMCLGEARIPTYVVKREISYYK